MISSSALRNAYNYTRNQSQWKEGKGSNAVALLLTHTISLANHMHVSCMYISIYTCCHTHYVSTGSRGGHTTMHREGYDARGICDQVHQVPFCLRIYKICMFHTENCCQKQSWLYYELQCTCSLVVHRAKPILHSFVFCFSN